MGARAWLVTLTLSWVALTACSATTTSTDAAAPSTSPASRAAAPRHTRIPAPHPATGSKGVAKMLVFVVENHSLDQMTSDLPLTFALAERFGYATRYRAVAHPSLPNYLAMTGGSTFAVTDDDPPDDHPIPATSVFGQALASGETAKLYAEAMPGNCVTSDADTYAVKHNPWAYYTKERAACGRYDVPLPSLQRDVRTGRLPRVGMVIPDLCNDAHDCDLAVADGWLREQIGLVTHGPDWRTGRLLIVITADEDDDNQGNLVLTVMMHPALHHVTVSRPLTHYSLARAYSEVVGARPLGRAALASSLLEAFGLVAGGPTTAR